MGHASVGPAASHMATHCLRLREYFDKNGASAGIGLIVCAFPANKYRGQFSVFSFQCSVRRKRAGAAGSLPSMRVRLWRTSRPWLPQVSTNWSMPSGWVGMVPNREKRSAQLCTFPNMLTQANTIPAHPGTSPNMPARSCTTVEPPSPTRKPLYKRLHRWIRSSFAFRDGRQAGLGRVAKALKSNERKIYDPLVDGYGPQLKL